MQCSDNNKNNSSNNAHYVFKIINKTSGEDKIAEDS